MAISVEEAIDRIEPLRKSSARQKIKRIKHEIEVDELIKMINKYWKE